MAKSLIIVALMWATLMITFCFKQSLAGGTDSTIVPGANGADVVHATITKIAQVEERSQSLRPENRLLLRIAWVETGYGVAPHTYSEPDYHGGIWRVDRDMFKLTRFMYYRNEFNETFEAISTVLGISWDEATWDNCRQPLYSALAARLYLHNADPEIPPGWSVEQQANYWQNHYHHDPPTGTVTYFIDRVSQIPGCTNKGIDLVFVIDGSGSVGSNDFVTSKTFVQDVVDYFEIGSDRTRVGVIQYSSNANIEFHLNQYTNEMSLHQAIADIHYLGGGTNTEMALGVMADESFLEENGARGIGIPRVAVIITDGQSQGPDRVRVPADRARDMGITMFAIGVTSNVNEAELVAIANEPSDTFVFHVTDFDAIPSIGATLQDTACNQPAVLSNDLELITIVGQSQTQNFAQPITEEGTTFSLQATDGILYMYGSATVPNPNSALNDFQLIAMEGQGIEEIFIGPEFFNGSIGDGGGRRRRQVTNQNDTEANSNTIGTVYISIEGKQATNAFSLVTAEGDVTEPEASVPEPTQPDSTRQDSTQPDSTRQDSTRQDSTRPDFTRQDSTQPDSTQPDSTQPDSTRQDSTQPDSTRQDSTQPDSTQPDYTQPDSTRLDSTRQDSTQPDFTRQDSTQPDSTQPDSTQPDSTRQDSNQPDSTNPDSTQPESTQSENNQTKPTKVETTKSGNGSGTVTTTMPYILLMVLNGVIITRLAIAF